MLLLQFITTVMLSGVLADAIDSDNGTWFQSYPIRSGLPKQLMEKDLQGKIYE